MKYDAVQVSFAAGPIGLAAKLLAGIQTVCVCFVLACGTWILIYSNKYNSIMLGT
jgi:hypothetical protein